MKNSVVWQHLFRLLESILTRWLMWEQKWQIARSQCCKECIQEIYQVWLHFTRRSKHFSLIRFDAIITDAVNSSLGILRQNTKRGPNLLQPIMRLKLVAVLKEPNVIEEGGFLKNLQEEENPCYLLELQIFKIPATKSFAGSVQFSTPYPVLRRLFGCLKLSKTAWTIVKEITRFVSECLKIVTTTLH